MKADFKTMILVILGILVTLCVIATLAVNLMYEYYVRLSRRNG